MQQRAFRMLALLAFEDVEAAQRAPLVHEQPHARAAHLQRVRGELRRRLEHLQQAAVGADAHAGKRQPRLLLGPPTLLGVLDAWDAPALRGCNTSDGRCGASGARRQRHPITR